MFRQGRGTAPWRPRQLRALRWAGLLLVVTALTIVLAGQATANPTPTPVPTPAATPSQPMVEPYDPNTPNPLPTMQPSSPAPAAPEPDTKPKRSKAEKRAALDKKIEEYKEEVGGDGGVLGAFQVTDKYGIPISAYMVTGDSGGWKDWKLKVEEFLIDGMFTATKWMVALACWLIVWALSWSFAEILLGPARAVSESLYSSTLNELGLPGLFLVFSGVVAAWHLFFGSRGRGWGELAASLLISSMAATVLSAPPDLLLNPKDDGLVSKARELGLATAAIVVHNGDIDDVPDADAADLTRPITDALVDAFVVQPSMLLSYNQVFTGKCAELYAEAQVEKAVFDREVAKEKEQMKQSPAEMLGLDIDTGIVGDINEFLTPRSISSVMDQYFDEGPGAEFEDRCIDGDEGDVAAAKKISMDKVGGAFFVALGAFLVTLLLGMLGFSYLAVQALLAFEAMLALVALTVGILPGPGRAWLWQRVASVIRGLGLLVVLVVALGMFIVAVLAVMDVKKKNIDGGLTVRFVILDILVIGGFMARERLMRKSKQVVGEMRARLGKSSLGGSTPSSVGGGPGMAQRVRQAQRGASMARRGAQVGVLAATGGVSAAVKVGATGHQIARKAAAKAGKFGLKHTEGARKHAWRVGQAVVDRLPEQARGRVHMLRERLRRSRRGRP